MAQLRLDLERLLTPRQREVRALLRLGLTNTEIARRMGRSTSDVKYHVAEILNKLGVANRYEAGFWPETPPWYIAAFAPVALLWRKARSNVPVKPSQVATGLSSASFVAVMGGLALIGVLLARVGGDTDARIVDARTLLATIVPSDEAGRDPLPLSGTPGTPDPAALVAPTPAPFVSLAPAVPGELDGDDGSPPVKPPWTSTPEATPTPGATPTPPPPGPRAVPLAAGSAHTCAIRGGYVWCWGNNDDGQLGNGTTTSYGTPVRVVGLAADMVAVAAGGAYSCAVTDAGAVRCWGADYGTTPVDVPGLSSGVAALAAGWSHACAVMTTGGAKCWGSNGYGQLGDGTTVSRITPVDVVGLGSGVAAIAAGGAHTCALLASGGVKCWGDASVGELGDGTSGVDDQNNPIIRMTPVAVTALEHGVHAVAASSAHTCALLAGGSVSCWGLVTSLAGSPGCRGVWCPTPVEIPVGEGPIAAFAVGSPDCGLTTVGAVKCWQRHDSEPVGVPGLESGVTNVAVGGPGCAFLRSEAVKCWGSGRYGQLGDGRGIGSAVPVDVVWSPTPIRVYPNGVMAIDCDAAAQGVQGGCAHGQGTPFRIQVHVMHLPLMDMPEDGVNYSEAFGYFGFDVHLRWGNAQLDYLPAADPADEALWPNCNIPARAIYLPKDPSLLFACIEGPGANVLSTFTGAILEFEFQCRAPGTTAIELIPRGNIPETHFRDAGANQIDPDLANATITCR